MSQRRLAKIYRVSRVTVQRKLKFLAQQSRIKQKKWLESQDFQFVQFDDLETIEHTKLKPVTVTLCVDENRRIIDFCVAQIPAKGHLAKIARKKYGRRANHSFKAREELFSRIKNVVNEKALFQSDQHSHYKSLVKRHFPKAEHQTFKGSQSCVSGQGELKKLKYDPLFKINHTFAMLRANINRLIRRTWCTTKKIEALEDHIAMYVNFHNQVLT